MLLLLQITTIRINENNNIITFTPDSVLETFKQRLIAY